MLVIIYSLVEKGSIASLLNAYGGNIMDLITWGRAFRHPALLATSYRSTITVYSRMRVCAIGRTLIKYNAI